MRVSSGAAPLIGALACALTLASAAAAGPLRTAINENGELERPTAELFLQRMRAAGLTALRLPVPWSLIATRRPADPTNPNDPAYDWRPFDAKIQLLRRYRIEPIAILESPPPWAVEVSLAPKPLEAGRFARAAAEHYSGRTPGIPRIRYWQIQNEPNVNVYYAEPWRNGRPYSPILYRRLVNAIAPALHAARADNIVIAGGLSPFTINRQRSNTRAMGPLRFMRTMLCMSKGPRPRRTCNTRVQFDVWSHHPYTSGGPTHHAFHPDDVSLGDLPEMVRLLRAAVAARQVASRRRVRFWVTEFGWDTNPPDKYAVPVGLHARWVAHSLYVMWRAGVELVTWLQMRDQPMNLPVQSGLYFRGRTMERDRAKPALTAIRFPFVALRERGRTRVWGRTPTSRAGAVVIEHRAPRGWRRVTTLRASSNGIFTARLSSPRTGRMRARMVAPAARSLPFSLARVPDRFVRPFGCGACP